MSPRIIPHIFGSLTTLEKSVDLIERRGIDAGAEGLKEITEEMRKAANLIQLQFAKKDIKAAERSLQIFYGLLSMIRPIIIDALKSAAYGKAYIPERAVLH